MPAHTTKTPTPTPVHRLSPLDASWLYVESPQTPMHVGCLEVFAKPKHAGRTYTLRLYEQMLKCKEAVAPYSLRLKHSPLSGVLPAWEEERFPDLEYHVRRTAVAAPGGPAELTALLGRLQRTPLDLDHPLWEYYIIDGLKGHRFAVFVKVHHSLVDGIGGMHLLQSALSAEPGNKDMPAPWAFRAPKPAHNGHLHGGLKQALELAMTQLHSGPGLMRAFAALGRAALPGTQSLLSAPYTAPVTPLNGKVTAQRDFALLQLELPVMLDLAHRAGVKLNDVFLAVCGGALRRYLKEAGALPAHSLLAGVPVSVRPKGDTTVGTAITFALARLGTDLDNPRHRLQAVHEATVAAKAHLQSMDRTALVDYTLLLMAPYILELVAGLAGHGHPVFNVVISNVPGPDRPLYFNGARLEATYPMSVLTHGQGLNITGISYNGHLDIGYTACRDAVPRLQDLVQYTREAMDELLAAYPHARVHRAAAA